MNSRLTATFKRALWSCTIGGMLLPLSVLTCLAQNKQSGTAVQSTVLKLRVVVATTLWSAAVESHQESLADIKYHCDSDQSRHKEESSAYVVCGKHYNTECGEVPPGSTLRTGTITIP
jgi:hypothetical protein